ncbi:MAG TPA: hypothetical protein VGF84_02220 [Micromonosporaceae bacterium]|jgi:hypothetical protein
MTDRDHEQKAGELTKKATETSEAHEGNRASANTDEPQPTREPTRDRQK